jgi:hypothetical protein
MLQRTAPLLLTVGVLLALPSAAGASDTARSLISECTHTNAIANPLAYSPAVYQQALRTIPSDVSEYSDCFQIIKQAELERDAHQSSSGGGRSNGNSSSGVVAPVGGGGGPGATPHSVAELNAIRAAQSANRTPSDAKSSRLAPLLAINPTGLRNSVPTPLIVLVVLLGATALLAGGHKLIPYVSRRLRH